MPVSGKELASLDFANLIGGPLNAIVEAQAKSAITTANFIKEVGFTKDGKIVNVDFTYNRKNENGSDQEFKLTMPFLCMLPVPYISISRAVVEFNAKITSTTESNSSSNFKTNVDASAGGSYWFISAKVASKTAYQKTSSNSDKEERTFDMHVRVEAQNVDMPAGTERILTLLENSISEQTSHKLLSIGMVVTAISGTTLTIDCADWPSIKKSSAQFEFNDQVFKISSIGGAAGSASTSTKIVQTNQSAANDKLELKDVTGLVVGDKLEPIAGKISAGTTIASIDSTAKIVTLNKITEAALAADAPITFTKAAAAGASSSTTSIVVDTAPPVSILNKSLTIVNK
jgi:hypothetical protein